MSQPFDFDSALKALQFGQSLTGKDSILTPLTKQLTEVALTAELDSHLALDIEANRKNGSSRKTVKTPTGTFELATPCDRNGTFEPQLVMGPTISSGTPVVTEKMGQFVVLLPVSDNDPQGHLHDKCH